MNHTMSIASPMHRSDALHAQVLVANAREADSTDSTLSTQEQLKHHTLEAQHAE